MLDRPRRRNGREGISPLSLRCHCCSRTVLNWAPVSRVAIKVLANGSASAASL